VALRWAILPLVCIGCANESRQPWRAALDQGKVVKLGGEVGKLTPPSTTTPTPPSTILPLPDVEAPIKPPPPTMIPKASNLPPVGGDAFDIPPPPKAIEGKAKPVIPRGE
jgi:hypothetical protein